MGLYITLWIFYGMFKSNIECLFLRLSIKKWFLYKQISILLIIAIIKFIFYALSIYLSGYHNFLKIFYYFFVDNIFTNVLGLISIILLIIFYKNRLVSLITLIILIGFVSFIKVPVSVIDIINTNVLVLIVIYFLLLLIAIIFIKNMYVSLFEGSKER